MNLKIFISCNRLVNTKSSLNFILNKIVESTLDKVDINIIYDSPECFEYPALDRLHQASKEDNFYGLYLHAKGSSKSSERDHLNGLAWAEYMLYGLLHNKDVCLEYLKQGADLVGSMWYRHFKGNFFWFKSSYVNKLDSPSLINMGDRYAAEYWISQSYWWSSAPKPRVKNLFYLPIKSDMDFFKLKEEGYIPNINEGIVCSNVSNTIKSGDYRVFDKLQLTGSDLLNYGNQIYNLMNFNCILERIDL